MPTDMQDVVWPEHEEFVVGIDLPGENWEAWIAVADEANHGLVNRFNGMHAGCRSTDVYPLTATWADPVHVSMLVKFECFPAENPACSMERQTRPERVNDFETPLRRV